MDFPELKFSQIDGITCGPTSLLAAWLLQTNRPGVDNPSAKIEVLASVMGTNAAHGTTNVEMDKGLRFLGLDVVRGVSGVPVGEDGGALVTVWDIKAATESLKSSLSDGDVVLLRTSWFGMKHWVLAIDFSGDHVILYEPAAGRVIRQPIEVVVQFWAARGFDGFVVSEAELRDFPKAPDNYVAWSRNVGGVFK